jgi:hypothetical protein
MGPKIDHYDGIVDAKGKPLKSKPGPDNDAIIAIDPKIGIRPVTASDSPASLARALPLNAIRRQLKLSVNQFKGAIRHSHRAAVKARLKDKGTSLDSERKVSSGPSEKAVARQNKRLEENPE